MDEQKFQQHTLLSTQESYLNSNRLQAQINYPIHPQLAASQRLIFEELHGHYEIMPVLHKLRQNPTAFLNCQNDALQEAWRKAPDTVILKLKAQNSNLNHPLL
jgi:hypothetical protein